MAGTFVPWVLVEARMRFQIARLFLGTGFLVLSPLAGLALTSNTPVTPNTGPVATDNALNPVSNDVRNSPTAAQVNADLVETDLVSSAFARLHHVNMMEVEMGKLAMTKGQSERVRAYGERMMKDHQATDRRLMAWAEDHNIPVDRTYAVSKAELVAARKTSDKLHGVTPAEFDRKFLQQMTEGHARTVNDITQSIDQIEDGSARRFLQRIRPIVGQHEKLAAILLEKI